MALTTVMFLGIPDILEYSELDKKIKTWLESEDINYVFDRNMYGYPTITFYQEEYAVKFKLKFSEHVEHAERAFVNHIKEMKR